MTPSPHTGCTPVDIPVVCPVVSPIVVATDVVSVVSPVVVGGVVVIVVVVGSVVGAVGEPVVPASDDPPVSVGSTNFGFVSRHPGSPPDSAPASAPIRTARLGIGLV
jgi:hypothetical protein